jgi:hypothetical protein
MVVALDPDDRKDDHLSRKLRRAVAASGRCITRWEIDDNTHALTFDRGPLTGRYLTAGSCGGLRGAQG